MNDLFEYIFTSLIFGLVNGRDITFAGHTIPKVMAEENNNRLWMQGFNFDFFLIFDWIEYRTLV